MTQPVRKRYYTVGATVPFEEDATHEFKGHKNLSVDEVPTWASETSGMRTRQPISRAINGFLNTGRAAVVYLGITDDGKVMGLNLTQYQKDHLQESLYDLFSRYKPPVELHRFKISFVPAVNKNCTDDERLRIAKYDSRKTVDDESRERPHVLRSSSFCWCDKDCVARKNCNQVGALYIVEIKLEAWDPTDKRNKYTVGKMKANPIHMDETGTACIRRQACNMPILLNELPIMAKQMVDQHYQPKLDSLRKELQELHMSLATQLAPKSPPDPKS